MKLVQVGGVKRKKKTNTKSALMDITIFPEPGIYNVTNTRFWHVKGWFSICCYKAAKVSVWIPAGPLGQGGGLFSFSLSISVLVKIISYIYYFFSGLCIMPVHHCVL